MVTGQGTYKHTCLTDQVYYYTDPPILHNKSSEPKFALGAANSLLQNHNSAYRYNSTKSCSNIWREKFIHPIHI